MTAALEHPGIVPVHGLGLFPDGRPFYAMRLIEGEPFKKAIQRFHLRRGRPRAVNARSLPFRELLRRFLTVCDIIAYAHSRGVIHRDLKPSNVLLGSYGETLVVDWGLAKPFTTDSVASDTDESTPSPGGVGAIDPHNETRDGTTIGTPQFMSPEQAAGKIDKLGPATDVYSLGATFYFLLTGRAPFDGSQVDDVLEAVKAGQFPAPRSVRRSVPPALEAVCQKAMATDPAARYESPSELASDVEHWMADEPVSIYREPLSIRLTRWGRRHRSVAVGVGVLLLTAVVGLTVGNILLNGANKRTEAHRLRAEDAARVLARQLYINRINLAQREALDSNVTEAERLLGLCPVALRGWEWAHVRRLCHLERATFTGHSACVNAVAVSPDGRTIVSGAGQPFYDAKSTDQAELIVWDAATRRVLRRITGIRGSVRAIAFSPDGSRIAVGSGYYGLDPPTEGRLTIWETRTGRLLLDRPEPHLNVLDIAFSPDGRIVAAASGLYSGDYAEGRLKLWDVEGGELAFDHVIGVGAVNALAFRPDGRQIAVAGSGMVELWDAIKHERIETLRGHTSWVYAVAFSPDGCRLATGGWDKTVRLWNLATGEVQNRIEAHKGHVQALAFSPDGQNLVSTGDDGSIQVWDPADGRLLRTLRGHANLATGVRDLAFSPSGTWLASAGGDGTVKLWDLDAEEPITRRDHEGWVTSLAFRAAGPPAGQWLRRQHDRVAQPRERSLGPDPRRAQGLGLGRRASARRPAARLG